MSTALNYDLSDNIATLAMDDGKANALNVTMLQAINDGLDRALADKAAVVVIQGREKMFSGGFDLSAFKRELAEMWKLGRETVRLLIKDEVGVIKIRLGRKKVHTAYSVPESVAKRIHTRLLNGR